MQHLLHWVCFPLWGSATTTMNEYQTNSNNFCRFNIKFFFHFVFFLTNLTQYMLCTCVIGGNEKLSYETCHLEYLELGLSFQIMFTVIPFSPCTVWQSLRFQTNHAPSVYSAPPSNEKGFTLMLGLENQLCYRVSNQEISIEKSPHMGWLLRLKVLFNKAKRNKRGTGVCLYRTS